jgi:hypothetical protein
VDGVHPTQPDGGRRGPEDDDGAGCGGDGGGMIADVISGMVPPQPPPSPNAVGDYVDDDRSFRSWSSRRCAGRRERQHGASPATSDCKRSQAGAAGDVLVGLSVGMVPQPPPTANAVKLEQPAMCLQA